VVSAPEEPETALARGAALASANAPLFSSSTAALAYAQDPGTGAINPYAVAPGYFDVAVDGASGEQALAYSAVPDEDANAYTAVVDEGDFETGTYTGVSAAPLEGGRRPLFLVASGVAAIFVVGAAALLVALAISMRPTAAVRPEPGHNAVAPKPAPAAPAAPAPAAPAPEAPAPAPAAPAPEAPAPEPAAPAPEAPAPDPAAPVPAPVPVAPAPAPVAPAPVPIPIPIPVGPPLGPWGHGGWGPGGDGGFGGGPGGGFGGGPGGGFGGGPGGGFGGGHGGFGGGHGGFGGGHGGHGF
ncbi:MAG: hypothetical protein QOJ56_2745, partial [Mycobacterium sp.]|nr:hypothetical protein [Mycobacterium sp.]